MGRAAGRGGGGGGAAVAGALALALAVAAGPAPAGANVAGAWRRPKLFKDAECKEPADPEDNPKMVCKTIGDCPEKIKLQHCYRMCDRDECTQDLSVLFYAHKMKKDMVHTNILYPNNNCTLNDDSNPMVVGSIGQNVKFGKEVCLKRSTGSELTKYYKRYGPTEALLVFLGIVILLALVVGGILLYKRHESSAFWGKDAALKMRMSVGNYMGNSMAMGPGFSGGKTPQEAGITSPAQVPAQMQA